MIKGRGSGYDPRVAKAESSGRTRPDACPGALQVHDAADGPLARVRVPGGVLDAAQARVLAACADELGIGVIELTSRANVQVRGLRDPSEFAARIAAAGLLPSTTHERVRNIVAAPDTDRALIDALDRALCARPRLAELPGRFLFSLGDLGLEADVTLADHRLLLAGHDAGLDVPEAAAVPLMLDAAETFLRLRTTEWRIAELADGPAKIAAHLRTAFPALCTGPRPRVADDSDAGRPESAHGLGPPNDGPIAAGRGNATAARPTASQPHDAGRPESSCELGTVGEGPAAARLQPHDAERPTWASDLDAPASFPAGSQPGGASDAGAWGPGSARELGMVGGGRAVQVLAPLGRMNPTQALVLAEVADEVRLTPWRTVVVREPDDAAAVVRRLAEAGFVTDSGSPWAGVTACTGRPGCAKALADVHADAAAWVRAGRHTPGVAVHWAGCARRCGLPRGRVLQMVATSGGYEERAT